MSQGFLWAIAIVVGLPTVLLVFADQIEVRASAPLDQPPLTNSSAYARQVVASRWPQVLAACPGFRIFARDITHLYAGSPYYQQPESMEFAVQVADRPVDQRLLELDAQGNRCSYGIVGNAQPVLKTPKAACLALCTSEHESYRPGMDYRRPL